MNKDEYLEMLLEREEYLSRRVDDIKRVLEQYNRDLRLLRLQLNGLRLCIEEYKDGLS